MFQSRKGITPLVATVLLVAFSVGLGALVMSWGEEYVKEHAGFAQGTAEVKSECDSAQVELMIIEGKRQACATSSAVNLWIDNGPNIDLYNIHARVAGENGVKVVEEIFSGSLAKSNSVKAVIPYDASIAPILQVRLTPRVWTGRDVVMCPQKQIDVEKIPSC